MKTRSAAAPPRGRCTLCGLEFEWPASETQPTTLFPLMCGETFCRSCLAQRARVALSTRQLVPLRCCQRVVPHDYVREVLEPEEDVYYSFLLRQHRVAEGGANWFAGNQDLAATSALPAPQPKIENVIPVAGDIDEEKQSAPVIRRVIGATTSVAVRSPPVARLESIQAAHAPVQAVTTKATAKRRGARGRYVGQQATTQPEAASTILQLTGAPSGRDACHVCGAATAQYHLRFESPCGHVVCRNCLNTRVLDALSTDKDGDGDGAPVDCCGHLLPLELVQRFLSRRELTQYKKLIVKHASLKSGSAGSASKRGVKRKVTTEKKPPRASRKTTSRKTAASLFAAATPTPPVINVDEEEGEKEQDGAQECTACLAHVASSAPWFVGPCGHGYCETCITQMAKKSLHNRGTVPIRCCSTEFPVEYVERVLPPRKLAQYKRFLRERDPHTSTLRSDHVYAQVVRQQNGKQCPVCGIGVVKIDGCQAMVCALGHAFCWGCGHKRCICAGNRVADARM